MGVPGEAPATSPQSTSGSSSLYESTGSRLTSPTSPGMTSGRDRPASTPGATGPPGNGPEVRRRISAKPDEAAAGAELFSVPPRQAPSSGIFVLPEAAFKIRDLDSGVEYALDKRFWIKDRDTGAVYVLEGSAPSGLGGGPAPDPAAAESSPGKVRDLFSGRTLTLDEFEDTMGYSRRSQLARRERGATTSSEGELPEAAAARLAEPRGSPSRGGIAGWLERAGREAGGSGSPRGGPAADGLPGLPVRSSVHGRRAGPAPRVRLVQRLEAHAGVIWTACFSRNGRYLASAGQDHIVRVWEVRSAARGGGGPSDGEAADSNGGGGAGAAPRASASSSSQLPDQPLLGAVPHRLFAGHKQDVLDLSWSRTQFLLSASMDKTVRLWHVSMEQCLRVFKHSDFVTAIDFHPDDDRTFVSGSIDGKLRLWSIPDQKVLSWQDVHEMVTAASFVPSGQRVAVGTMKGKCRFYAVQDDSLEYEAQIDVKNARGQHARGKKVTGVAFVARRPSQLLVTSNDSRVRLYDGYSLRAKFKGHANRSTQIRAAPDAAGATIVCGSDDGWVYRWAGAAAPREKVLAYDCFQAASDVVTVAIFAPERALESYPRPNPKVIVVAGYSGDIKVFEDFA
ncbi:hypothetical protein QBZ16_005211 [Prototheca wickerhamii]|uniref:WD repeat-containing protein 44 n=1 Tax=Prototheca wickerhamii TaxID=3111 RepID=A0AAD9MKU2_PROWI|nr:hypothetical protein QBZ16_005211 [Prototheca wickerhamii]